MKILIINDNGTEVGGVETYLSNLKRNLKKNGHKVLVLTSKPPTNSIAAFNDESFTPINQKSSFRILPYTFNPSSYRHLKEILKKFEPDIVHLHFFFYHTSPSILTLLANTPTVMTIHSHELIAPVGINYRPDICDHPFIGYCIKCTGVLKYHPEKFKRALFQKLKKNIDLYISPSNYYEKLFSEHGFGPIKRLPYGLVEEKDVQKNNNKLNYKILFIGRLVKEKGAQYIIQALPKILEKFPKTKLTIVGTGEYEKELKALVKKMKLSSTVIFTGKIPNEDTPKYYKEADMVVALSDYPDNLPLICIEAMKYGKPIIASNIGGFPDLVKNTKNGFLISPGDVIELTSKVITIFNNETLRKDMSKNAYEILKLYYLNIHIEKLLNIYKGVIKKYEK